MHNLYLHNKFILSGSGELIVPPAGETLLVVFWGESNAGGLADNADATSPELAVRSSIQKLDEYTLLFEDLDIGTNNLQDHFGLTDNATHGWENGLGIAVDGGIFAPLTLVHLVKGAQGGSLIAQWNTGGSYMNKFEERVDAAKSILAASGISYVPIIWASQGINDANAATDPAVWKAALINRLAYIRTFIGGSPYVLFTRLLTSMTLFNIALDEIAAADDHVIIVDTPQPPSEDSFHWGYAQMKTIAADMADLTHDLTQ
jgi:hypothetical protein